VAAVLSVLFVLCLPFSGLTMTGALRRGQQWRPALLTGLFFPVAWVVWYVHDQPPRSG
jgi:hypothetical protein